MVVGLLLAACGGSQPHDAESPREAPTEEDGGRQEAPGPPADDDPTEAAMRAVAEGAEGVPPGASSEGDPQTETWIRRLGELLPGEFCKEGTFFRQCFTISAAECEATAAAHYTPCVSTHRAALPLIRSAESGQQGGEIIGSCVGVAFHSELEQKGKFISSAKCNDADAWGE